MDIPGTRGAVGKAALNSNTKANELCELEVDFTKEKVEKDVKPVETTFNLLFEVVETPHSDEFTEDEIHNLDILEDNENDIT